MGTLMKWRVARGVKLLDRSDPWWFAKIQTDKLNMYDVTYCVLGQLCNNYVLGLDWLGLSKRQSRRHGFNLQGHAVPLANWDALTQLWTDVVRAKVKECNKRSSA